MVNLSVSAFGSTLTSRWRAVGLRVLAGLTAARFVDPDDPEAVGGVGPEHQLEVIDVSRNPLPLLPPPLPFWGVVLLSRLHNEL